MTETSMNAFISCGVSFRAVSPVITLCYMYFHVCMRHSYRILTAVSHQQRNNFPLTCIHMHPPLLYSQYQINVSEIYSTLSLYNGWDYTEFTALAHVPLRPPNDYYPHSDISASGPSLDGSHINILAIVKNVRNIISWTCKWYSHKFPDFFLITLSIGIYSMAQTFMTYIRSYDWHSTVCEPYICSCD